MLISAVVLTKNEEQDIKDCLENLKWVDEIIVVDDDSEDRTLETVKKYTDKIFKRSLNKDFAAQRNYGLGKASGDWILFLDADERITSELSEEIRKEISRNQFDGFYLKRDDVNFGHRFKYGETGSVRLLRLAKKEKGKWERSVHEVWKIKGNVGFLKNPIIHYSHPTIFEFVQKINTFTDLDAESFYKAGRKVYAWEILVYPTAKFVLNYFFKQGFRDGIYGFIFAGLMSGHSFLTRIKLWLLYYKNNV